MRKGKASGKRTSDGFVVLKGSIINPTMTKSCPERAIKDRKKYEDKIDSNGILTADVPVSYTHLDVYKRQPLLCVCSSRRRFLREQGRTLP